MAYKFDGVIEAVRFSNEGQVVMVRAYERRGPAFSDHILLDRQALLTRLKSGKRFVLGQRLLYMAGTFKVDAVVRALGKPGQEVLTTTGSQGAGDHLEGAPLF